MVSGASLKINASRAKTAEFEVTFQIMSNLIIFDILLCVIIIIIITIIKCTIPRIDILQF